MFIFIEKIFRNQSSLHTYVHQVLFLVLILQFVSLLKLMIMWNQ